MNLTSSQHGLRAEEKVKKILEREFNTILSKRKLVLVKKSNGEEIKKEFDGSTLSSLERLASSLTDS